MFEVLLYEDGGRFSHTCQATAMPVSL